MSTILVVDDSQTQREYMIELLTECGYTVKSASNGKDALVKIRQDLPDLVILDIVMPERNGFQACRDIKEDPKTKHIPVIICSTKNTEADIYWALKQGASDYVIKPYEPEVLLTTIKRIFRNPQS